MNVDFKGYNENVATFEAESTVEAGDLVKMTANGKVAVCGVGENFIGVCVNARGGYAAVQLSGYIEVKSTSNIGLGYKKISVGGICAVKADTTSGREHLIVYSTANKAGIIL